MARPALSPVVCCSKLLRIFSLAFFPRLPCGIVKVYVGAKLCIIDARANLLDWSCRFNSSCKASKGLVPIYCVSDSPLRNNRKCNILSDGTWTSSLRSESWKVTVYTRSLPSSFRSTLTSSNGMGSSEIGRLRES